MMRVRLDQGDLRKVTKKMRKIKDEADRKEIRKELLKGGQMFAQKAKENAPESDEKHSRYSAGKKTATYYPGNLKRSIQVLRLPRASDFTVVVGPKLAKRATKGTFKGRRVDGWYAHLVEFGNANYNAKPFMRPAYRQMKQLVSTKILQKIKMKIERIMRTSS